jgi:hypothetical protein
MKQCKEMSRSEMMQSSKGTVKPVAMHSSMVSKKCNTEPCILTDGSHLSNKQPNVQQL